MEAENKTKNNITNNSHTETKNNITIDEDIIEIKTINDKKLYRIPNNWPESKDIWLYEHQVIHYKKQCAKVQSQLFVNDGSEMGKGKTIIKLAVAQRFGLPLWVLSPKSAQLTWQKESKKYNIPLVSLNTYAAIRGNSKYGPKDWLDRTDEIIEENEYGKKYKRAKSLTTFTLNAKFHKLIEEGVMVVFDEAHHLKNTSGQAQACAAIVKAIAHSKSGISRVSIMSGTLFDKQEHAENMLRLMNIITHRNMVVCRDNGVYNYGMQELINYCNELDKPLTQQVINKYPPEVNHKETTFNLFVTVIKTYLFDTMPTINKANMTAHIITNSFFTVDEDEKPMLTSAILKLSKASRYDATRHVVDHKNVDWNEVKLTQQYIEILKVNMVTREAIKVLQANEKAKVVLILTYLEPINMLLDKLDKYNPVCIVGNDTLKQRERKLDIFNEANTKCRVFISNKRVAANGINLDDRDGNYPRTTFVFVDYDAIANHQSAYRTHRGETTKSPARVHNVFANLGKLREDKILDALARKGGVLRALGCDEEAVKYPGEYNEWYDE